jgi:uncharacterized protein YhbP (UPF0306 family)
MGEDIKQRIIGYLASHKYLSMATVDADGKPVVHTMGYAPMGATVYCLTPKDTRKLRNIIGNQNVAYVVDEDYDQILHIKGVQMKGKASVLENGDEIQKAVKLIVRKFPEFAAMGPNPRVVIFKIEPEEGYFVDYSKGIGHSDRVRF